MIKIKILIVFIIIFFIGTYFYMDFQNDRTLYLAQQEYEEKINANTNFNYSTTDKADVKDYINKVTNIDGTVEEIEDAFGKNGFMNDIFKK